MLVGETVAIVVSRIVVVVGVPVRGPAGDDKHPRRDDVRLEPAHRPFDAYAYVATAGKARYLGGTVRFVFPDGSAIGVRARDMHLVSDVAQLLQRADGDHVLGRARR